MTGEEPGGRMSKAERFLLIDSGVLTAVFVATAPPRSRSWMPAASR
jgi:hypothetical protein